VNGTPPTSSTNTSLHQGRVSTVNELEQERCHLGNIRGRERQGNARQEAVSLGLIVLCILLGGVVVWDRTSGVRDNVFVQQVDEFGQEQPLAPAAKQPVSVGQHIIHGVVQTWIERVRWVTPDSRLFTKMWDEVEAYTTQGGLRQLDAFRKEQELRQQAGRLVQITVGSFARVDRQANSYTIDWREEAYDTNRQLLADESGLYLGYVTIADFQSKLARDEMDLRRKHRNWRNVFGVFVDGVSWVRRPLPPMPAKKLP
jgi:type IV secretory pathway TrbF-like protein